VFQQFAGVRRTGDATQNERAVDVRLYSHEIVQVVVYVIAEQ